MICSHFSGLQFGIIFYVIFHPYAPLLPQVFIYEHIMNPSKMLIKLYSFRK